MKQFCSKGYKFLYYFRPGQSLSYKDNLNIYDSLITLNNKSHKFKFGLFEPEISFDKILDIFKDLMICLIFHEDELVGFYYFYILEEKKYKRPLVQIGLLVITKNTGQDIFKLSQRIGILYTYAHLGFFNCAVITTIPKIAEGFSEAFSNPWPSPFSNLSRAPSEYKKYVETVSDKYIKKFFPNPFSVNKKRFTLILDKRESGFHDRFHYLPMADSFAFNSFCKSWINYEENEDLIIIAKFNLKSLVKNKILYYMQVLTWTFQDKIYLLKRKFSKS